MAKQTFGPLLAALILALTVITIPRHPFILDDALSERAVLSYAHQNGLQFGTDIIFTYGPLGFLTSRYFFSHAAGLRMALDAAMSFTICYGLCLVAWRLRLLWRGLLLGVFGFLSANIDPRADLLIYVGLLCWGLLCLFETGPRLALCASSLVLLSVIGMLEKVSFFFIAGLSVAAIASDLMLRGKPRVGLGMMLGIAAGIVFGWIAAGQKATCLPAFITNALSIILGYDQSVGLEGLQMLRVRGLLLVALTMATGVIRALTAFDREEKHARLRRLLILAWVSSLIFMIWKHSFVRTDVYHVGFFFGFAPVLALALEALPTTHERARLWARGFGVGCCCLAVITLQSLFFPSLEVSLSQPFRAIPGNLRNVLKPAEYCEEMTRSQEAARADAQLPKFRETVGRATVDVFGQNQGYALFNDLSYHPRPVFQSYMAYNARLMRLNEQFYASKAAPDYVLFELAPIDHKFPPLEDAMVLRYLLTNYEHVGTEGGLLLLKSATSAQPRLTFLRAGLVRPGERIDLKDLGDANLWMEIRVQPTWLGRARQLFYKPSPVRLSVRGEGSKGKPARFRAPVPMMAAGFLASPFLARGEDVQNLYAGKPVIRPESYSVELSPGSDSFWQPEISFRIYKIENRLGGRAAPGLTRPLSFFRADPGA